MADVVNLRQARKQRAKVKKRAKAAENAVKHGLGKAQRTAETSQRDKARATLEAHRREPE